MWRVPGQGRVLPATIKMRRTSIFLSGGGFKTLSFCGVLDRLDLSQIKTYGGVSGGSILAFLYSLGLDGVGITDILASLDLTDLFMESISVPGFLYSGSAISATKTKRTMQALMISCGLTEKISFRELGILTGKCLRVFASSLHTQTLQAFDFASFPDLEVATALCASAAVPFLFEPVRIGTELYVDPAITNNLPINIMGPSAQLIAISTRATPISMSSFSSRALASVDVRTNFIQHACSYCARDAFLVFIPRLENATTFRIADIQKTLRQGENGLLIRLLIGVILGLFALFVGADLLKVSICCQKETEQHDCKSEYCDSSSEDSDNQEHVYAGGTSDQSSDTSSETDRRPHTLDTSGAMDAGHRGVLLFSACTVKACS
jgi:predicted acylesterase/phospholipase RssA